MDGVQDIFQRVRCVGIVHDGRVAAGRAHGVEPSGYRAQEAQLHEHVFRLLSEEHGCSVDGQEVGRVEASDELHVHFPAVDVEEHAVETVFQHFALEICQAAERVSRDSCAGVLHHHVAVAVIGIGEGKGRLRQAVEECFLGFQVVFKCLMVVQMVACQVGEDASGKAQASDAFLGHGV